MTIVQITAFKENHILQCLYFFKLGRGNDFKMVEKSSVKNAYCDSKIDWSRNIVTPINLLTIVVRYIDYKIIVIFELF